MLVILNSERPLGAPPVAVSYFTTLEDLLARLLQSCSFTVGGGSGDNPLVSVGYFTTPEGLQTLGLGYHVLQVRWLR